MQIKIILNQNQNKIKINDNNNKIEFIIKNVIPMQTNLHC